MSKPSSWSAEADRRFTSSDLGQKVQASLGTGSRSQRALSEFILRDPVFVATHGIEDLAERSGISPSTISRCVRDLGLSGFPAFRAAVGETVHALIAPVTKLGSHMADVDPENGAAEASLATAVRGLEGLIDPETARSVRAAAQSLGPARMVWTMGFGLSAHLAAILALGLQPYREGVVNVVQYGGTEVAAGRLMSVGEQDVVLALAFPRYSAHVTGLAKAARATGAHVIAITDSTASPLVDAADRVLLAPSPHPLLSASSLPALAIIEALVSEFMVSDPAHVERASRLAAAMAAYL
ncbi:MurR/RpiR family transcriptional regulator [Sulfitobacter sp. D35]|uniref:MurR/RpiR family transcriptional regulator n=1 Tax=Sulfitobacter sp. D35 TaxID=3083252 RepID=UPI00296F8C1A|nr:MurR/RpiR family transcriptional regulator [Sulfitobacter sp. D35]MDW4499207.1 MurR/RpiR family transcriptional regulator [Sulfitobacter sp. D35]